MIAAMKGDTNHNKRRSWVFSAHVLLFAIVHHFTFFPAGALWSTGDGSAAGGDNMTRN